MRASVSSIGSRDERPGARHPEEERGVAIGARPIGQARDELEGRPRRAGRRGRASRRGGVGLRERPATSDHAARELCGPTVGARARLVERSRVARLDGHLGEHEPAARGAARRRGGRRAPARRAPAIGGPRTSGTNSSTHIEMRWLSLIIGASCGEKRTVGLAARDARELGAERQVRLPARGDLGEQRRRAPASREKHAALSAAAPPASSPASAARRSAGACAIAAPRRARAARTRRARAGESRGGGGRSPSRPAWRGGPGSAALPRGARRRASPRSSDDA